MSRQCCRCIFMQLKLQNSQYDPGDQRILQKASPIESASPSLQTKRGIIMGYRYETHMHTCQASACGRSTGAEHVRAYKDFGYQGIIITDHFFGGNTAVPRDLPWKERVNWFCSGYEDALNEGIKCGLDVFFGWEQGYGDDEYLIYGLDKQWLLDHPEVEHYTRHEQLQHVKADGGCVIQAHPFRNRAYVQHIRYSPWLCDGIEVANGANLPVNDAYAWHYAKKYNLYTIAGSDNHSIDRINNQPESIFGVELSKPLTSIQDFVSVILQRKPLNLVIPQAHYFDVDKEKEPVLETFMIDENENLVPDPVDYLRSSF